MKNAILGQGEERTVEGAVAGSVQEEVKTVKCPFCGAATTPANGKCEFCGAAI